MLVLCAAAAPGGAALIVAEDFEYEGLSLITHADGGTGWADSWTGNNFVTVGSLSYGRLIRRGNKMTSCGCPEARQQAKCCFRTIASRTNEYLFEDGKLGKDNTTLWIAFLASVPGGLSTGFGGVSLYDDERQQLFLGDTGASDVWAFERTGQLQRFSSIRASAKVCFLVYRVAFLPGEEKVDMWVNPEPGPTQPPEAEIEASASVRDFRFNRVRAWSAPVSLDFDALRIATSYAEIAPIEDTKPEAASLPGRASRSRNNGVLLLFALAGWLVALIVAAAWWRFKRTALKTLDNERIRAALKE